MSRPEFPNCAMPPEVIRHIRAEQEYYDRDPERYERHQRQAEEIRMEEAERERQAEEEYYQGIDEQRERDLDNYVPPDNPPDNPGDDIKIEDLPF